MNKKDREALDLRIEGLFKFIAARDVIIVGMEKRIRELEKHSMVERND